ncbi:hypothetical protein M0Q28_04725 [Patescibacteria group bacterium]|jgi:hypothetical protein|nr:hypothetical protein [Patescibacteria group bacterium]
MRQILFLAHELEQLIPVGQVIPVGRAHRTFDVQDKEIERYADVRAALGAYGRVMREKTSGTFRRVSTPPHGIPRPEPDVKHRVLVEDPRDHASTVEVLEEQAKDVVRIREAFLSAIKECDAVVVMDEFESDTRGALIEHALTRCKPVLCLRRAGIRAPLHPMYLHRTGVMCWTYGKDEELRRGLTEFFTSRAIARPRAG